MKSFYLIATMLLTFSAVSAQISEVKEQGSTAFIYNDNGHYSGYSISLGGGRSIAGYNSRYVVVQTSSTAFIYDEKGSYTGSSISLSGGRSIKNVAGSNILVKDRQTVYYYDFRGSYTGNSTSN
jgi:hypothetical protein